MGSSSDYPHPLWTTGLRTMRRIKYELKCNFDYTKIEVVVDTSDGEFVTPEELARIFTAAVEDYSELDLGQEIH